MKKIFILIFISFYLSHCTDAESDLKIVDTILHDSSSYFFTDLKNYRSKNSKLPIGVFDSGTGGLTVLDAIVNYDKHSNKDHSFVNTGDSIKDFNSEYFIYLADQANMPYGNYEAFDKSALLREHVLKDMQFLLDNKYYRSAVDDSYQSNKSNIKALVIACNTATAFGMQDIIDFVEKAKLDLKVIGVIGAGVRGALDKINKYENITIGVMATAGTVASNGYVEEFNKYLSEEISDKNVNIIQQAGVGLAGAIDGAIEFIDPNASEPRSEYKGPSEKNESLKIRKEILNRYNFDWSENHMLFSGTRDNPQDIQINSVDNYISFYLTTFIEKVRKLDSSTEVVSIVLGCTHYPFYIDIFASKIDILRNYREGNELIYSDLIADTVHFIDPAVFTAKELYDFLKEENLFNKGKIEESEFYISVPNLKNGNIELDSTGNFKFDYKYGRNENKIQEYVKRVPLSAKNVSSSIAQRLKEKIPLTFSLVSIFNNSNEKVSFLKEEDKLK